MEVTFQTKEESNKLQQEAFLKLSGTERVLHFFKLSSRINQLPVKHKKDTSANFEIVIQLKDNGKSVE